MKWFIFNNTYLDNCYIYIIYIYIYYIYIYIYIYIYLKQKLVHDTECPTSTKEDNTYIVKS